MHRSIVLPRAALRPYVDRLWTCDSAAPAPLPRLLPGTGAELWFHHGEPPAPIGAGVVLCVRRKPLQWQAHGRIGFIAVRLRAGALRHFCATPLGELDDATALADVWRTDIDERLALAPDNAARLDFVQDWLLQQLARHGRRQPAIEHGLRTLYYGHRDARIDTLADRLGCSRRHFERVFRQEVGLTPKAFQRTARFQLTMRDLLLHDGRDPLATALDHGYYDQAHFIHEVRRFTGQTPARLTQSTRSHFYNPPLLPPDKVPLPH